MMSNIILIGFMGCGKSAVAECLAKRYGFLVFDTDAQIVKRSNMSIVQMFQTHGEEYFRTWETNIVKDVLHLKGHVVATGGGMVKNENNMKSLQQSGFVVYLQASAKTLYEHTKQDKNRPLLQTSNPLLTIETLLGERLPLYERFSHCIIGTDGHSIDDIAQKIFKRFTNWQEKIAINDNE